MAYSTVILLGLCLGLALSAPSNPKPCSTPACKAAAAYINDAMNASANPCESFYEFACGGWRQKHTIPDEKSRTGTFDALNDKMTAQIRELLDKFDIARDSKTAAASVSYGAYIYQQCLALGKQTDAVGLAHLKEVVNSVLGGWWIGQQRSEVDHPWNVNYVKAFTAGISSVFQLSVMPDPKNVTVNKVTLDPAAQGLGDKELQNLTANAREISAYKNYIRKAAKLFCADKCQNLDQDIDDIVNLESQLASSKLSVEEQRNPETLYNVLSYSRLQEKTKFDFLGNIFKPILKALGFAVELDPTTTLIVSDVNYTIKAIQILNNLKTPARTLANYIGWRIVSEFGPHSSSEFRQIEFEFHQVTQGIKKMANRSEVCQNLAYNKLDFALSRLFVEHHFTEKEKNEAAVMIGYIQDSFRSLINKNTWLDDATKQASLSKLNHITKNVAYPAWLLKNDQLDEYYNLLNKTVVQELLSEKNYLQTLVTFAGLQLKSQIINFNKKIDIDKHWPMPPAIINAAYEPEQNSITIPAGILKAPFFDSERPFALNHGFIGVVIGHELSHGLDDQGRQYDEQGNLRNWWTPAAIKSFDERSQCFVNEYGSQVEKITGLHLNGRNTLGENIADNGGLHESFNAYKAREAKSGPSPTLADLPKFTSDQLYFLSYANTWCDLIRPEKLKQQIEYDPHSPSQYRVNVPLSNSADFAKAFNCPAGSPMNPTKKCLLW